MQLMNMSKLVKDLLRNATGDTVLKYMGEKLNFSAECVESHLHARSFPQVKDAYSYPRDRTQQ
jgi:hypothetical protein